MKLDQGYLTKLSTVAGNMAKLQDGNPYSSSGAYDRIHFDDYMKALKVSPDKFVQDCWKRAGSEPDAKELASDMRDAVKSCTSNDHCAASLRVLSDAAYQEAVKLQCKAIENMSPQGTGAAAADAIRTRGGLLRPLA